MSCNADLIVSVSPPHSPVTSHSTEVHSREHRELANAARNQALCMRAKEVGYFGLGTTAFSLTASAMLKGAEMAADYFIENFEDPLASYACAVLASTAVVAAGCYLGSRFVIVPIFQRAVDAGHRADRLFANWRLLNS